MSLFKRGADILRANLNDLLAKAEDPEKMLNQYILDAQDGLQQSRVAVHDAITAEKDLQSQWDAASADVATWERRATLAESKGDANLLTQAVTERRKAQNRLDGLKDPLATAQAQTKAFKTQVDAIAERIAEAAQKKDSLVARAKMAKARQATADTLTKVQADDPASNINSMEAHIRHLESAAAASEDLLHTHRSDLEDQFRALETEHDGGSVADEVAKRLAKNQAAPVTAQA
jgi:phage shock protein A